MQDSICSSLEQADGQARFREDKWSRDGDGSGQGGGGITRVLEGGKVFEKAGVNFSEVHGLLEAGMSKILVGSEEPVPFYATGTSLVIHPLSPLVPTVHANLRYLEVADKRWFGGGTDLTPYYLFDQDAVHFHTELKRVCDQHDSGYYSRFKKWCDEYFFNLHRLEARGVGGIFFDYLGKDDLEKLPSYFDFVQSLSQAFQGLYLPIVSRRAALSWDNAQREFQLLRRGRYVEFNLLYDRGTQFGLRTKGRTESILMSLPPLAKWLYDVQPAAGSEEARLVEVLKSPKNWV